jgi:twinkle protein
MYREKKEYIRPPKRLQKLSQEVIDWFETRGISNNTLLRMGITESTEWMPQWGDRGDVVCFNYFRDGELVNIKMRGPGKEFKMISGAELIFYNLDGIKGEEEAICVEGEMDCLSAIESGVYNVVSVPNGASAGNMKLDYLENCWKHFEDKKKIIIATDGDEPGIALRDELARRLGKHRCFKVDYPEGCKDTNDVLLKYGKDAVRELYANARPFPVEGVFALEDLYDQVNNLYTNGYPDGIRCGIPDFDEHFSFNAQHGELTTVTGSPGSGKSEFVDWIVANTIKQYGWHWGVFSFETPPDVHVSLLMEKLTGKAFGFRSDKSKRMNQLEAEQAALMLDEKVFFVNTDEADISIDGILETARILVVQKGVKGIVCDPFNWIDSTQDKHETETQYINKLLTKIKIFCAKYDTHFILIAHPRILKKLDNGKYEVPTMYHISGSAHFFNKTDNGFTVYRHFDSGEVDIHIQKVKRSWLGKIGMCRFVYNTQTRQYEKPVGLI